MAGHFQPDLVVGAAVLEEIETGRGVCFNGESVVGPGGAPEVASDDMGEEFQVGNIEVLEVGRGRASDKFVVGEIEDANAGQAPDPPIRAGIFGDVGSGGELQ